LVPKSTFQPGALDPSENEIQKEMGNDPELTGDNQQVYDDDDGHDDDDEDEEEVITKDTSVPSGEADVATTPIGQLRKVLATGMISHIQERAEKSPSKSLKNRMFASLSKIVKRREQQDVKKKWADLPTASDANVCCCRDVSDAALGKSQTCISSPLVANMAGSLSPLARAQKLAQKFNSSRSSQVHPF